jgi:hypothetical protein
LNKKLAEIFKLVFLLLISQPCEFKAHIQTTFKHRE